MVKDLNRMIDYIEEHLTDDLSLERLSEDFGIADYHLRMTFFYLSGMTLSGYIKKSGKHKFLLPTLEVSQFYYLKRR